MELEKLIKSIKHGVDIQNNVNPSKVIIPSLDQIQMKYDNIMKQKDNLKIIPALLSKPFLSLPLNNSLFLLLF